MALMDVLKHPGAVFLEQLARGPATEDELLGFAHDVDQSTGNRKLKALRGLGLVEQDPGKAKAPGRRWRATLPEQTKPVLLAAFNLSDAVAERDRQDRAQSRTALEE
jgi:hypothetical protein